MNGTKQELLVRQAGSNAIIAGVHVKSYPTIIRFLFQGTQKASLEGDKRAQVAV